MRIIKVVIFVMIFVGLFYLLEMHASKLVSKNDASRIYSKLDNSSKIDVMIIGTSHGVSGIDPSLIKLRDKIVVNFAVSGSGPEYHYNLYKYYISRYLQKPQYIIYTADWFILDERALKRNILDDVVALPTKIYISSFLDNVVNVDEYVCNRFNIFKIKKDNLKHLNEIISEIGNTAKTVTKLLFADQIMDKPINSSPITDRKTIDTKIVKYNDKEDINKVLAGNNYERQLIYLNKFLDLMSDNGITTIFVQTPEFSPPKYGPSFSFNNRFLLEYANKRQIPYLNYNYSNKSHINLNQDYFVDWGHLNKAGRSEFSKMLSIDLQQYIR